MAKEIIENVKDDAEREELEMLLDEIPHATSHNLLHHRHRHDHHHHDHVTKQANHVYGNGMYYDDDPLTQIKFSCASSSPVSGFSLQSDGSSSSVFSACDTGSPTPSPFEDLKAPHWFDSKIPDSTLLMMREKPSESFVDQLGLCANFSKMCVGGNPQENPNVLPFRDSSFGAKNISNYYNYNNYNYNNNCNTSIDDIYNTRGGDYNNFKRGFCDSAGFQSSFPRTRSSINHVAEMDSALSGLTQDYKIANLFGSQWHDGVLSQLNGFGGSMDSPRHRRQLMNDHYCRGGVAPELVASLSRNPPVDASLCAQKYGMNLLEEMGVLRLPNYSLCTNFRPCTSVQELLRYGLSLPNARAVPPSNGRIPQGNLDDITSEGSFIIQGEGLNYSKDLHRSRCQRAVRESGFAKPLQRSELDIRHQVAGYESPRSPRNACSFPLLPKYNSLVEARGSIYLIAKDQHGCRFLQRVFDEGTLEEVQVIFNEIIGHVVELMMNPFGNYLMQKLLDVCSEEQRMQIILMVTEEPGQLVRISLNTHGTRVVQKLIETLKTRQQISLVVSALEPGFLALIKDLNGNHVVQHCLQCLSNEDNKFIFVAAAKYCVDIATHQHGCCVLQRCIRHSSGEHREKLVAEISANALLLAQDQYGNYVVQFILDLRIPSATTTLSLQFEGNYVHLSMQKFSSHVVEKCLAVFDDENRSRVIRELLSAPHFEQLLQDPHANYVVQSALRHSEGHVHNSLVEAIESHKAISRNSPYSKKIFSQKLMKK